MAADAAAVATLNAILEAAVAWALVDPATRVALLILCQSSLAVDLLNGWAQDKPRDPDLILQTVMTARAKTGGTT